MKLANVLKSLTLSTLWYGLAACNSGGGIPATKNIKHVPDMIYEGLAGSKVFALFVNTDVKVANVEVDFTKNQYHNPLFPDIQITPKVRQTFSDPILNEYCADCTAVIFHNMFTKRGGEYDPGSYAQWGFSDDRKIVNQVLWDGGHFDVYDLNLEAIGKLGVGSEIFINNSGYSQHEYYFSIGGAANIILDLKDDAGNEYRCPDMGFLSTYGGYRPLLFSNLGVADSWDWHDFAWDVENDFPMNKNKIDFRCQNNQTGEFKFFQATYSNRHSSRNGYWLPYIQIEPFRLAESKDAAGDSGKVISAPILANDISNLFNQLPKAEKKSLLLKYNQNLQNMLTADQDIRLKGGRFVNFKNPSNSLVDLDSDVSDVTKTTKEEVVYNGAELKNDTDINQPIKSASFSYSITNTNTFSVELALEFNDKVDVLILKFGNKTTLKSGYSHVWTNTKTFTWPDQQVQVPPHSCVQIIVEGKISDETGKSFSRTTLVESNDYTTYLRPGIIALIDTKPSATNLKHYVIKQADMGDMELTGVKIPLVEILKAGIKYHLDGDMLGVTYDSKGGGYRVGLPSGYSLANNLLETKTIAKQGTLDANNQCRWNNATNMRRLAADNQMISKTFHGPELVKEQINIIK